MFNVAGPRGFFPFEIWNLRFVWNLVFGAWDLRTSSLGHISMELINLTLINTENLTLSPVFGFLQAGSDGLTEEERSRYFGQDETV